MVLGSVLGRVATRSSVAVSAFGLERERPHMSRRSHLEFSFVSLCAVVLSAGFAQSQADAESASWTKCADAIDWFVRVDTPDTEVQLDRKSVV